MQQAIHIAPKKGPRQPKNEVGMVCLDLGIPYL